MRFRSIEVLTVIRSSVSQVVKQLWRDLGGRGRRKAAGVVVLLLVAVGTAGCSVGAKRDSPDKASGSEVVNTLSRLLPSGIGVETPEGGQRTVAQQGQSRSVSLVVKDSAGAATVTAELFKFRPPAPKAFSDCPDPAYHPYSKCQHRSAGAGDSLILNLAPVDETRPSGPQRWTAVLTKRDGSQVVISEFNAVGDKKQEISRVAPTLAGSRLLQMATSPLWVPVLKEVQGPGTKHTVQPASKLASAAQLAAELGKLLPTQLTTARPGGGDGFGHLTANDGKGQSLVGINVQRWTARDRHGSAKLFSGAAKLPDGTLVSTSAAAPENGGRGTVEWSVDTLRPDGLRVRVFALNAAAYVIPADRAAPAVGIPVLRQIALSPVWRRY